MRRKEINTRAFAKMSAPEVNTGASQLQTLHDNVAKPLKTFTRFPDLPTEIRLKIWSIHLKRPQIIILKDSYSGSPAKFGMRATSDTSSETFSLLHANQESRDEALKLYVYSQITPIIPPTYINYAQDTLFLDLDHHLAVTLSARAVETRRSGSECNISKFRFLICHLSLHRFSPAFTIPVCTFVVRAIIRPFSALEELTIVKEEHDILDLEELLVNLETLKNAPIDDWDARHGKRAIPKIVVITKKELNARINHG